MAKLKTQLLLESHTGSEPTMSEALTAIVADLRALQTLALQNQRAGKEWSHKLESTSKSLSTLLVRSRTGKLSGESSMRSQQILHQQVIRKRIERNQEILSGLFQDTKDLLARAIETDKAAKAEVDAAWSYLKAVLDIAIIATASAFGGPAGGLIASGIVKASPTMLASGIFSSTVIGPTELEGADGASYYSLDVVPKGMSASENALFRIHASVDQVGALLSSALSGEVDHSSDVELPKALGSALEAADVVSEVLTRATKRGTYLMATYVVAHLTVPNIYEPLFKYFHIAKLLGKEDLASFVGYRTGKSDKLVKKHQETLDTRFKKTHNKVLKARIKDKQFVALDATFSDYPDSYDDNQVAILRAHMAGFIKHVEAVYQRTLLLSRSVTGGLKRSAKTDLLHRTEAGSNLLKSYFRQDKPWGSFPDKMDAIIATMRRPFAEHTGITDTRSNPLRLVKHFDRRSSETARGMDRKRLFLSWFIVHRMFELHTGHPIPALMPPVTQTQLKAFAEAVADILDLCSLLISLQAEQAPLEKGEIGYVRNSMLFCALVTTPGVLDLTKLRLGKETVRGRIRARFAARHASARRLAFERSHSESIFLPVRRRLLLEQFETLAISCGQSPKPLRSYSKRSEPDLRFRRPVRRKRMIVEPKRRDRPFKAPKPIRKSRPKYVSRGESLSQYRVGQRVRVAYHSDYDVVGTVTAADDTYVSIRIKQCYRPGTTTGFESEFSKSLIGDVMRWKHEQVWGLEP